MMSETKLLFSKRLMCCGVFFSKIKPSLSDGWFKNKVYVIFRAQPKKSEYLLQSAVIKTKNKVTINRQLDYQHYETFCLKHFWLVFTRLPELSIYLFAIVLGIYLAKPFGFVVKLKI